MDENTENNGRLASIGVGAVIAAVGLSVYSLFQLAGTVFAAAFPFVAGVTLFVGLMTVFLSIVYTLKGVRKSARKQFAIWDCYTALAIIAVLGYFLAACVATFQPGANPSALWTNGIAAAAFFVCLFGGGKWAGALFNESGKSKN